MDSKKVQALLLDRYGIRVAAETSNYVLRRLDGGSAGGGGIPVMGADARTGVPVRQVVDLREFDDGASAATV